MCFKEQTKKLTWAGWVITGVVAFLFGMSGVMKMMQGPEVVEGLGQMGWPASRLMVVACLELLCVIFYLIPRTAVLGAVLFTGYVGGMVATHMRLEQPVIAPIIFGAMIWLGVYLREPQVRKLLPIIKNKE